AEHGFNGASTEMIARRMRSSIGSLYQFFPDKLAIFQALADRCVARSRVMFEQLACCEALHKPWHEQLDMVIDAFAMFHRSDPSYRAVWMNLPFSGSYIRSDIALRQE